MAVFFAFIFFGCLLLVVYVYAGYPLLITCIGFFKHQKIRTSNTFDPFVTILIPAYNEEAGIRETVANKLALAYPPDKMEILVISDGSQDRTDQIVSGFKDKRVKLLRQEPRAGKTSALNMAVTKARGDILVFSDANSIYAPDALRMLVRNFADSGVGYVTGKMIYTNLDGSTIGDGCSAYMKYENWLREMETRTGSVIGVDGGIDAVRRDLYSPMNPDQLPDFVLPLHVADKGYRVVYEPGAILKEPALNTVEDEHKMRVRVTLRALWALYDMRHLLSFKKDGLFAFQLWSHKVLRYLCFIFLVGAYGFNLLLVTTHFIFGLLFFLQTAAYACALISPLLEKRGLQTGFLYLFYYFTLINYSAAVGFIKFLRGQKQVFWTPRKG
ncbi:MAG: glycosyltransferase family 2 protein [Thermodesulfobacteriota bacterium]|nr:glycosyltransferase family 2 protein [Thermodesulfobacteriota bacterium]